MVIHDHHTSKNQDGQFRLLGFRVSGSFLTNGGG